MEPLQLTTEILAFLFAAAVIAGFIDTLVGGGGLITIPALILSGVPPLLALGTNKLQGSVGTATSSYMMISKKKVQWQHVKWLMLCAFIGSVAGTLAVQMINTDALSLIIPAVLSFIALYFLIAPNPGERESPERISKKSYGLFAVPSIGFYDGMFGPGTGSFFSLSGVALRGQNLLTATATAKTLNFSTNIASLIIFYIAGQVLWTAGLVMMLGQAIGAWLGAHTLFRINLKILRPIIVIMCFAMLLRYATQMQ